MEITRPPFTFGPAFQDFINAFYTFLNGFLNSLFTLLAQAFNSIHFS